MAEAGRRNHLADIARLSRQVAAYVEATEALCALAACLTLRSRGLQADSSIERALGEVVDALGLAELVGAADRASVRALEVVLRGRLIEAYEIASDPAAAPGWRPTNRDVMEGQALTSETLGPVVRRTVVPRLDGLSRRLEQPGAAFLEVGVGAGGLVVSLCREWRTLYAVGIDVWEPALMLARERVAHAELERRIELRDLDVSELEDRDVYDLSWLPANFVAERALPDAIRRVQAATRPGGWILLSVRRQTNGLSEALARLRSARAGGSTLSLPEAESMLRDVGWTEVRSLVLDLAPLGVAVGRRSRGTTQ